MEEEVGGIHSLAKEDLGPPEARRGKEGSSWGGFIGTRALLTCELELLATRTVREYISDLKPPRLWQFCYSSHRK